MTISFIRIDDRMIHGQIVTRWAMEKACDGILLIDNKAATNPILNTALKSASSKKVLIFTQEQFLLKYKEAINSNKNYFLITRNIEILSKLLLNEAISSELNITTINVGPQSARAREQMFNINRNADLSESDVLLLEKMYSRGYEFDFRLVPDSNNVLWSKVRKKILNALD